MTIKKIWKTIKPNFSSTNKTQKIILVENEEVITENKQNVEIFNKYFINTVKELNIPDIHFTKNSDDPNSIITDHVETIIKNFCDHPSILKINEYVNLGEIFSFEMASELQIENEINAINVNKAPGADNIPANIIKECVDIMKYPLTKLFNTSVIAQHFPDNLKYANVTPLFKKNDNTDKTNYRPIITSVSKFFERILFKQITVFIENKISSYLYDFRKGYNTQPAPLGLPDKINT